MNVTFETVCRAIQNSWSVANATPIDDYDQYYYAWTQVLHMLEGMWLLANWSSTDTTELKHDIDTLTKVVYGRLYE